MAEKPRAGERADEQLADGRRLHRREIEERRSRRSRRRAHVRSARQRALVEPAQLVARPFPGGAFVARPTVQGGERDRLRATGPVLHRAEQRGDQLGGPVRQAAIQLQFGADAFSEAAVQLEQQVLAVRDRGAPVVRPGQSRLEGACRQIPAQLHPDRAQASLALRAAAQSFEQGGRGRRVSARIDEGAGGLVRAAGRAQVGDDGLRRPLA